MTGRKCPSCGQESSGKTVYCPCCGAILPKAPSATQNEPLLPAVAAEAARQSAKRPGQGKSTRARRSIPFLPIFVLLAVSGLFYLVLSDAAPEAQPPRSIKNASFLVSRSFASSKFTQATLTQDVINSVLWDSGGMKSLPILGFVNPPDWSPMTIVLEPDKVVCHVIMSIQGHRVRFSETFRIEADPGVYRLAAESANIGHLPLVGPLASFVTPVFRACSAPFANYLGNLRGARSLSVADGTVTFSTR